MNYLFAKTALNLEVVQIHMVITAINLKFWAYKTLVVAKYILRIISQFGIS
jgi:hypothetical protein